MSWAKLTSAEEWAAYKKKTAVDLGMDPEMVHWGSAPAEYPCLAASTLTRMNMRPDGFKIATCFVLPADARELLGQKEVSGAAGMVGGTAAPQGKGSDDTEFKRYVVANLLTIVDELRSVKITNPGRYEEKFNVFLADVDQATVSQAANVCPSAIFGKAKRDADQDG